MNYTQRLVGGIFLVSLLGVAPAQALCPGDCNGDGSVTIDELVRAVNVALGTAPQRICPAVDTNGDGQVTIDELIQAVRIVLSGCPATVTVYRAPAGSQAAGPLGGGRGVLPNGRSVGPAGVQIPTETLPLNLALSPDGQHLLVTNDGYSDDEGRQFLQVVDTSTLSLSRVAVPHFFGVAFTLPGDRVFVANDVASGSDTVESLRFAGDALVLDADPLATLPAGTFPTGMAVSPDGTRLFVLGLMTNTLWSIDIATGTVLQADAQVGNLPYSVIVSADGQRAYVSSWGINNGNPNDLPAPLPPLNLNEPERSSVAVLDISNPTAPPHLLQYIRIATDLRIDNKTIYGGSHPSALQLSPDGTLLYVTASNVDVLVAIDTTTFKTVAEVALNVFENGPLPQQLQGFYPNALAVSADGRRIYVADAGINAVQVISVDPATRTFTPLGFIPAGWFPSALALSADGKRLYVANGKGDGVGPNGGDAFDTSGSPTSYIGQILKGSVSVINGVDTYDLAGGTAQVVAANGFTPVEAQWVDGGDPAAGQVQRGNPVPVDFGSGPSDQITYVVYILKENRTYDQVLGDLPRGNGDPNLTMYGANITPNQHALAMQYAIGDNFYDDGEVSTPGHEWVDQGNCNDFIEKLWPSNYDRTLPSTTLEMGQEGFAKGGFIFEALERAQVSFRIYGETLGLVSRFAAGINGGGVGSIALQLTDAFGGLPTEADLLTVVNGDIATLSASGVKVDVLRNDIWPNQFLDFPSNIIPNKTDVGRAALFQNELASFSQSGTLPQFIHIWLPNDHTFGADPGSPTPQSAVADNDAGLGLIVDALTHSPFWPHMAIFVTEDDAQDGQDHVAAHRTIDFMISPYVKHGYVSPVHHSNVSMTKTIELLLGVPPMSEFDRYATDTRDYFTATPDLTPFVALPRQVPVETNPAPQSAPNAYLREAGELSAGLNLAFVDEAGPALSQVLWLQHLGRQVEHAKRQAMAFGLAGLAALIAAGAFVGRFRVAHSLIIGN